MSEDADDGPRADQVAVVSGVSWREYELLREIRGARAVPWLTYEAGRLEVLTPSAERRRLGRRVMAAIGAHGVTAVGRVALAEPGRGIAMDADVACGRALAIEVCLDESMGRLALLGRLGVAEVWLVRRGLVTMHAWRDAGYARVAASAAVRGVTAEALARSLG